MDASQLLTHRIASLLPSGVRRLAYRRALQRRYGLHALGPDIDHRIRDTTFEPGCRLGGPVYIGASTVGAYTYIEVGCRISMTRIGRFCSIAPHTFVGLAEHPTHFVSTHPLFYRRIPAFGYDLVERDEHVELTPTTVGNDVWIGAGACVRAGVTIGDGAIVGAGAVVTHDVPAYAVVGGIPAKPLRHRFDAPTIERLLASRWWDRELGWLRTHAAEMRDIDAFLALLDAEHDPRPA